MSDYVTDTMAVILRLENRRLPQRAKEIFKQAEKGNLSIFIPAMVFAELAYLSEKGRISASLTDLRTYLDNFPNIDQHPMVLSTVENAFLIDDVPELHDRLIAGVAKELNLPIITNDPAIQKSNQVTSIWD